MFFRFAVINIFFLNFNYNFYHYFFSIFSVFLAGESINQMKKKRPYYNYKTMTENGYLTVDIVPL